MGGMLIFGIVLAVAGLSLALFFDVAATLFIAIGIIIAIVGGATAVYGGVLEKVWGLGLLALGLVIAVMGLFMSFLLDLWIVQWVIRYGGMIMVVSGVIMAGIGLIGMFKGDDDKRIDKLIEKQLKSMK
ncbi:MAG: hypothetical protein OXI33_04515 [Chloroflexota bacterium]|nr:hypothetical protein [Chloroflexota bacterium]